MRTNVIIVDNFYDNPEAVREFALAQNFNVDGNYPGKRTDSFATDDIKKVFEQIIGKKIDYWPPGYNGAFQYTTKEQNSWVHRDLTAWAGVIYLSPDAPATGTAFFRHKVTGLEETPKETPKAITKMMDDDSYNMGKWTQIDNVGNVFNRLILFRGSRSHRSMEYFGDNKENGRLFQTWFFNAEE